MSRMWRRRNGVAVGILLQRHDQGGSALPVRHPPQDAWGGNDGGDLPSVAQ